MSMGPLAGINASAAGVPLSQTKGAETERTLKQAAATERQNQAASKAEAASGIGKTEGDEQTSDRDADGRRLWEDPTRGEQESEEEQQEESPPPPRTRDAKGEAGNSLDLIG